MTVSNAAESAPLRQQPSCPRCRASGDDARIQAAGDQLVCFICGTTWQRGDVGQMVAVRQDVAS